MKRERPSRSSIKTRMGAATRKGGEPSRAILREALHRIVEVAHPEKVILFGSAARGEMGPDSDLDLLVVVRPPVHRRHLEQDLYQHMIGLGAAVDIMVVTTEDIRIRGEDPGFVLGNALHEGQVVYGEE